MAFILGDDFSEKKTVRLLKGEQDMDTDKKSSP